MQTSFRFFNWSNLKLELFPRSFHVCLLKQTKKFFFERFVKRENVVNAFRRNLLHFRQKQSIKTFHFLAFSISNRMKLLYCFSPEKSGQFFKSSVIFNTVKVNNLTPHFDNRSHYPNCSKAKKSPASVLIKGNFSSVFSFTKKVFIKKRR